MGSMAMGWLVLSALAQQDAAEATPDAAATEAEATPEVEATDSPETAPAATPATPTPAAAAPAALERYKLLVLDLVGGPNDAELVRTLTNLIPVQLSGFRSFDVLSTADVKQIIQLEADREAVGCADSSCLAEIAGAMGANIVIFGEVTTLGATKLITLNLFDSAKAVSIGRVSLQNASLETLPAQLKVTLWDLVTPFLKEHGAEYPERPAEPDAQQIAAAPAATADPAPVAAADEGSGPGVVPWAVMGAGVLGALGGGVVAVTGFIPMGLGFYAVSEANEANPDGDATRYRAAEQNYKNAQLIQPLALAIPVGAVLSLVGVVVTAAGLGWGLLGGE